MTLFEFVVLMLISVACTTALWYAISATVREVDRWRNRGAYSAGVLVLTTVLTLLPWAVGVGLLMLDFYVARAIL